MPRYRPPEPTTRSLLDLSLEGWDNATLRASTIDWHSYAFCYRRAADTLVDQFAVPALGPDGMFLPILFLYRHYLEVSLKGLLADCGELLGEKVPIPTTHKLTPIWQQLHPILERALPGQASAWMDRIGALVEEFQKLDPTSMTFRYPVDTGGDPLMTPGFQVNPKHIKDTMKEIFYVLDSAAGFLSDSIALKYEQP